MFGTKKLYNHLTVLALVGLGFTAPTLANANEYYAACGPDDLGFITAGLNSDRLDAKPSVAKALLNDLRRPSLKCEREHRIVNDSSTELTEYRRYDIRGTWSYTVRALFNKVEDEFVSFSVDDE